MKGNLRMLKERCQTALITVKSAFFTPIQFFFLKFKFITRYNNRQLVVVGEGGRILKFVSAVKAHPEWGLNILGVISDGGKYKPGDKIGDADVIGKFSQFERIIRRFSIDEVIFIVAGSRLNSMEKAVVSCENMGVKATIALDLVNMKITGLRQKELEGVTLVTFETVKKGWKFPRGGKHEKDIVFADRDFVRNRSVFHRTFFCR
jgi:FlaA1/EpsC-like NDP-sugar epimerase